jgi:hypothetical protein
MLFPLISVPVKNIVFRLPGVRFGKDTGKPVVPVVDVTGLLCTPLNV